MWKPLSLRNGADRVLRPGGGGPVVRRRSGVAIAAGVMGLVVMGPGVIGAVMGDRPLVAAYASTGTVSAAALPADSVQMVLGISDGWNATRVTLFRLEKRNNRWVQIGSAVPARIGPTGLAWGVGVLAPDAITADPSQLRTEKVEGDRTAPAGVFRLGPVFTYDAGWSKRTTMPVVRVGANDLFVEDPASPQYNTHVRLDHAPSTPWEKREQMQQDDPAHRLKVFVGHNVDPPVGGKGSAIFLHVWRSGGAVPTAGCTAMDFGALSTTVKWLRADAKPLYVLLPRGIVDEVRETWALPRLSVPPAKSTTGGK